MRSSVDRICAQIQRHLRAVSRDVAKPRTVETTEEKPRIPAGLGDARMRFELERYFTIDITEDVHNNDDFEFADPESLKIRPGNLSTDEAYRWDAWEFSQRFAQSSRQFLPSPAEIDYCTLLARLDKIARKQDTDDNGSPGLLEQFAPIMTNPRGRPLRRAKPLLTNPEVTAR